MVTIGAFTLAVMAVVIIGHREYRNIKFGRVAAAARAADNKPEAAQSAAQKSNEWAYHYHVFIRNFSGHLSKLKAIVAYARFVYSTTAEEKQAFRHHSSMTADKMLAQYRHILSLNFDDKLDKLQQWKVDLAAYEKYKPTLTVTQNNVIQVQFGQGSSQSLNSEP